MAKSTGNSDCVSGEAIRLALEMPNIEAIGLTHATVHTPLLHTVKNMGIIELTLPESEVQIDFAKLIMIIF
jgi:hypothetical protein